LIDCYSYASRCGQLSPGHYAATPGCWGVPSRTRIHPAWRKSLEISAWRCRALAGRLNVSITDDETSQWGTTDTSYVRLPQVLTSHVSVFAPRRKTHRRMLDSAGDVVGACKLEVIMPTSCGNNDANAVFTPIEGRQQANERKTPKIPPAGGVRFRMKSA
jgi:hypothetical protein